MSDFIEKKKSIHEQMHDLIKERIINGTYLPKERLFEAKLAREFGISRSPVREAIRTLENEGLILQDAQSRIFVYSPSADDVCQIYQCRQVLESLAVSLAADHATSKELEGIMDIVKRSAECIKNERKDSKTQLIHLNSLFHDTIIELSKNKRLQKQLNDLRTLTFFYRRMNVDDVNRREEIIHQHLEIAQALLKRDKVLASNLMHSHILRDMNYLIEFLNE